jgi:succinoglycan biosynthesis transport protein ExoP
MNSATPQGDRIDLADYFSALLRFRIPIVVVTIGCAAIAAGIALVEPRSYAASATLAVSQPKWAEASAVGTVSAATFRPLLESRLMAAAVIHELGLDKAPYNLAPARFLSRFISIEEVHPTNLITVTATFDDPQRAAAIAQSVAEHAVTLAQKVNIDEATRARDFINEQLGLAKERLERAESDFRTYQNSAQIEALQKDVDATLGERSDILDLLVKIEAEKAKRTRIEEELAKRQRVDVLKKTIDSEPVLSAASRDRAAAGTSVLGMQLQSESISSVFEELDGELASTRANLAALEAQKAQLVDQRHLDASTLPQLSLLYERTGRLARLQVELDLAQKIYVDVVSRFEAARLQVAARSAQLEIIDPAVVPDAPESRNVVRNSALAGLIGLTASVLAALVLQAVRAAAARV